MKLKFKTFKPALINLGLFFIGSALLTYILSYNSSSQNLDGILIALMLGLILLVTGSTK